MGVPKYSESLKKNLRGRLAIVGVVIVLFSIINSYGKQLHWSLEGSLPPVIYHDEVIVSTLTVAIFSLIIYFSSISRLKYLFDMEDAYISKDPENPLVALDKMADIICSEVLLYPGKSVGGKCRRLENVNRYTKTIDPQEHNYIHGISIYKCFFALAKALDDSPMIRKELENFEARFVRQEVTDFTAYYRAILGYAGMIDQQGQPFSVSAETLKGYKLPEIRR